MLLLLAVLAACDMPDVLSASYESMDEAVANGGVAKGWIPGWLPHRATNLREIHNIDTNESALVFDIDKPWTPFRECMPIAAAAIVPSRYEPKRWPSKATLAKTYEFFRCPSDTAGPSVFVGVSRYGKHAVHWRVFPR